MAASEGGGAADAVGGAIPLLDNRTLFRHFVKFLHQTAAETGGNARMKIYPDGTRDIMFASRPIFREPGWEEEGKRKKSPQNEAEAAGADLLRAMRRARAAVREIALCNHFTYFVTLTLDKEKVDRYNMDEITKKLNNWLDNQVRRRGLRYVLVPERHKDGAIHFHGFFNDALEAVASRHFDKQGHEIFNLPAWRLGFTTAIRLYGDYHKAVAYVCKYIGKQGEKPGGRWYYSGGDLARPEVVRFNADFRCIPEDAFCFEVTETKTIFWMWTEATPCQE